MTKQDKAKAYAEMYTEHFIATEGGNVGLITLNMLRQAMQNAYVEGYNRANRDVLQNKEEDKFKEMLGYQ